MAVVGDDELGVGSGGIAEVGDLAFLDGVGAAVAFEEFLDQGDEELVLALMIPNVGKIGQIDGVDFAARLGEIRGEGLQPGAVDASGPTGISMITVGCEVESVGLDRGEKFLFGQSDQSARELEVAALAGVSRGAGIPGEAREHKSGECRSKRYHAFLP